MEPVAFSGGGKEEKGISPITPEGKKGERSNIWTQACLIGFIVFFSPLEIQGG
jgi:hypothetical protein